MSLRPAALLKIAATLLLGTAAGLLFYTLHLPLPWMLGPMIVCAVLSVAGLPLSAPTKLRPLLLPIIGVMMGSRLSPQMLSQAPHWLASIALLPALLGTSALAGYFIYRYVVRLDPTTSFYSAMPGGFQEMLVLGTAAGGDERQLAIAHSVRVMLTVFAIAILYALVFGVRSSSGGAQWTALGALSLQDYLILALCALAGRFLGQRLHLPAGDMFAPMILSGIAHMTGIVTLPPPSLLITATLIVLGTVTGCRFVGMEAKAVLKALLPSTFVALVLLLVSLLFALLASHISAMPLAQTFLAFSAGGVTEMGLLSFAMGLDVAFVSVIHILRVFLVVLVAQPIFKLLRNRLT